MNGLEKISIRVEEPNESGVAINVLPILHEVHHALRNFIETGEPTIIDLRGIPFGPSDEKILTDYLGQGEVHAELYSLGESRVWETRFSGVWLVDHYNPEGEQIAMQIEIIDVPRILKSQRDDMMEGLSRMRELLRSIDHSQGTDSR